MRTRGGSRAGVPDAHAPAPPQQPGVSTPRPYRRTLSLGPGLWAALVQTLGPKPNYLHRFGPWAVFGFGLYLGA